MGKEPRSHTEKRVRLSGKERRAFILQSAKHVFAHSTYLEASIGELARESEITEPMLYKHFGSKKGLFLAVLEACSQQYLELLRKRIAERAQKDVLDALEQVTQDSLAIVRIDPEIQRVLFSSVSEAADPEIAQCIGIHNRAVYNCFHQLIEHAQSEGYLERTINTDAATWGYLSMMLAFQYGLILNFSTEIERNWGEMSRTWLRGLRTRDI